MKKKEVFKKSAFSALRGGLVPILFTLTVMVMIVYGLDQTERSSRSEGLRVLEDGLRRAVVKCYAVEGSYPENIAYIEEHYGLHIDRTKYVVHYEIFASNMLPDITVLELKR